MKTWKLISIILACLLFTLPCLAEEQSDEQDSYEKRVKANEEKFNAAVKAGKTIRGVIVEGNSLFNGTTAPQERPYGEPYTKEELLAAKFSAERNSALFILTKDGTLYYPTWKKGEPVTRSIGNLRFPRVFTEEQKKGPKLFTWATLVPMVGREVEVCGEVYPGYSGIKGIYIELIQFEGDYLIGE